MRGVTDDLNREDSRGLGTEVEKVSEPGNQVPFYWIYNSEEILTRHFLCVIS